MAVNLSDIQQLAGDLGAQINAIVMLRARLGQLQRDQAALTAMYQVQAQDMQDKIDAVTAQLTAAQTAIAGQRASLKGAL